MSKIQWKPSTLLAPLPAVFVSCGTVLKPNVLTVAWTGIVCSDPAMTYISLRPQRYSYGLIANSGEFVINLATKALCPALDTCGVLTGAKTDKFKKCRLTPSESFTVSAPGIEESPLSIECRVKEIIKLGSHDMFLSMITAVDVDEDLIDEKGRLCLEKAGLVAFSHGEYAPLGKAVGSFGYSVKKKHKARK